MCKGSLNWHELAKHMADNMELEPQMKEVSEQLKEQTNLQRKHSQSAVKWFCFQVAAALINYVKVQPDVTKGRLLARFSEAFLDYCHTQCLSELELLEEAERKCCKNLADLEKVRDDSKGIAFECQLYESLNNLLTLAVIE
jgi:hypothetical protein